MAPFHHQIHFLVKRKHFVFSAVLIPEMGGSKIDQTATELVPVHIELVHLISRFAQRETLNLFRCKRKREKQTYNLSLNKLRDRVTPSDPLMVYRRVSKCCGSYHRRSYTIPQPKHTTLPPRCTPTRYSSQNISETGASTMNHL